MPRPQFSIRALLWLTIFAALIWLAVTLAYRHGSSIAAVRWVTLAWLIGSFAFFYDLFARKNRQ